MPGSTRYQRSIARGLERTYREAESREIITGADELRCIVFSDHHRAARKRKDLFQTCERAYAAALGWYLEQGYTLMLLGDVEDLWTTRPDRTLEHYREAIALEREFHHRGRFIRFFGNHDDLWGDRRAVEHWLEPAYGAPLEVIEGLRIRVHADGRERGVLFFAHGHQGEFWNERYIHVSRWGMRTLFRPLQRLSQQSAVTPATDHRVRKRHNLAMYQWAARQKGMALIAGHTHKPVYLMRENVPQLEAELDRMRGDHDLGPLDLARERARIEWIAAQQRLRFFEADANLPPFKPCYFNAGCCSFADGDVTGLEIAEGRIRLVRWPNDEKRPMPKTIHDATLSELFEQL